MEDTTLEDARYQFEVNLFGLVRLTQPLLLSHARAEIRPHNQHLFHGRQHQQAAPPRTNATKHALEGWSDCLRIEVAPFGIDVVIIEPGAIDTEWSGIMVEQMMERSGSGPYADQAKRMADAAGDGGSPVTVIADVIVKSVQAKKPKTRYVAGKYARQLLTLRKLVSDRRCPTASSRARSERPLQTVEGQAGESQNKRPANAWHDQRCGAAVGDEGRGTGGVRPSRRRPAN